MGRAGRGSDAITRPTLDRMSVVVVVLDDNGFVHPRMDRADEQIRPPRGQRARVDRRSPAARHEGVRTGEERRWRERPEQDEVERRRDAAPAELRHRRERVRLAATVVEPERTTGLDGDVVGREPPLGGELVIEKLSDEVAEECLTVADA